MSYLFESAEWDFPTIQKTWNAIDKIGKEVFKLDYYAPQIEMITAEQMLDAYSSVAMPIMYNHWSFGKSFIKNERAYNQGQMGLAYEVVINTNPSIAYLMEENTMTMQTLVMAHAVCGHASFFKNNYLFKEWTDASSILDYLSFAKNYIANCEKKYGAVRVENMLDACHALQYYGVDKYKRAPELKADLQQDRLEKWKQYFDETYNPVMETTIKGEARKRKRDKLRAEYLVSRTARDGENEENILYYIEKNSTKLADWEREIVRIVRKVAQYFYPQMQTQLMNEGWATFVHYHIMQEMHDQELITDGSYIEFLQSHCGVVAQPEFDSDYYSGINVYALGFAMMQDIKRICTNPTEEDEQWFPDLVGQPWMETMQQIVEDYRDESFVLQFLSPKVIRDFKLFALNNDEVASKYTVAATHSDDDILNIRKILAKQYSITHKLPQIEVTKQGQNSRTLFLQHTVIDGTILDYEKAKKTLKYVDFLWGDEVELSYVDTKGVPVDRVQ